MKKQTKKLHELPRGTQFVFDKVHKYALGKTKTSYGRMFTILEHGANYVECKCDRGESWIFDNSIELEV